MKKIITALCAVGLLILHTHITHTTLITRGNNTAAPFGLKTAVQTTAYLKKNGTLFVGLNDSGDGTGNSVYALSKTVRPVPSAVPQFRPVISNSALDTTSAVINKNIDHLDIAERNTSVPFTLAFTTTDGTTTTPIQATAVSSDGCVINVSGTLADRSGTELTANTGGIINLATDDCNIFALLNPDVSMATTLDSLALVNIQKDRTGRMTTLQTKNAQTGVDGNQAIDFRATITPIAGGGAAPVNYLGGNDLNKTAMHWDSILQRLYIGVRITIDKGMGTRVGKSVVVAREQNGTIQLEAIAPDSAIIDGTADGIIVFNDSADALPQSEMRVVHLGVMHASTGPDYLIVNGGIGNANQQKNAVYALPLVNDPTDPSVHGTLAIKAPVAPDTTILDPTTHAFTEPATGTGQLPIDTDIATQVGMGPLPILDTDEPSAMVVDGDTVYISVNETTNTGSRGIWFSQAIFDDEGKVARWTPWTKRAVPFNAFPTLSDANGNPVHNGSVRDFAVDLKTGNIWVVEGMEGQLVGLTTWTRGVRSDSLPTQLNTLMSNGSYSALDLDQSTLDFTNSFNSTTTTIHRYALFGGVNQVVFARTSQSAQDPPSLESEQTVITDFTSAENILSTTLPDAGCVQVLEYARQSANGGTDFNYFFAGTQNGLFVFGKNNGEDSFSTSELGLLNANAGAFGIGSGWKKAPNIPGSVVDVKSSGLNLYVLVTEQQTNPLRPTKSTLYRIDFAATVTAMFAAPTVIAETNVAPFANVLQFYAIQPLATGPATLELDEDQLIMATSGGLFKSNAAGATGVSSAANQTDADWQLIDDTGKTVFPDIATQRPPVEHTVWPISIERARPCPTLTRGTVNQLSGRGFQLNIDCSIVSSVSCIESEIDPVAPDEAFIADDFLPKPFTFESNITCTPNIDPIRAFWPDGARRIVSLQRPNDPPTRNRLGVIPFRALEWNVTQPTILQRGALATTQRFFWIMQVGATGYLLVGTENGVVALE